MESSQRLALIHALAQAVQVMSRNPHCALEHAEKINDFAEMIHFLAARPDSWIAINFERFIQARDEAIQIIEREKLERA